MALSAASCLHYFSSRYGHIPVVGGRPVHSRASTARLVDIASQQLVEVPAATPRDTHLVTIDGEQRAALLLELARTNKVTVDIDSFALSNVTRTSGQKDPAGGTSAYLLEATAANGTALRSATAIFTTDGTKAAAICLRQKSGTTISDFGISDASVATWRHLVRVTWSAAGVPTLSTVAGAGTRFPVIALGEGWYLFQIGVNGVVGANADAFYIYPGGNGGAAGEVYAYNPQAEDGAFATSIIRPNTTRAADSFYWDFLPVPQAMMVYCRFVEAGTIVQGITTRLWQIGNAPGGNPRAVVHANAGVYRFYHQNSTGVEVVLSTAPAVGDTVELLGILQGDGAVQLIQSINGAAVTATALSAAEALGTAWSGTQLWLNSVGATVIGANRFAELKAVKYADVVGATAQARMDEMRTFELGPNRELLASGS